MYCSKRGGEYCRMSIDNLLQFAFRSLQTQLQQIIPKHIEKHKQSELSSHNTGIHSVLTPAFRWPFRRGHGHLDTISCLWPFQHVGVHRRETISLMCLKGPSAAFFPHLHHFCFCRWPRFVDTAMSTIYLPVTLAFCQWMWPHSSIGLRRRISPRARRNFGVQASASSANSKFFSTSSFDCSESTVNEYVTYVYAYLRTVFCVNSPRRRSAHVFTFLLLRRLKSQA